MTDWLYTSVKWGAGISLVLVVFGLFSLSAQSHYYVYEGVTKGIAEDERMWEFRKNGGDMFSDYDMRGMPSTVLRVKIDKFKGYQGS